MQDLVLPHQSASQIGIDSKSLIPQAPSAVHSPQSQKNRNKRRKKTKKREKSPIKEPDTVSVETKTVISESSSPQLNLFSVPASEIPTLGMRKRKHSNFQDTYQKRQNLGQPFGKSMGKSAIFQANQDPSVEFLHNPLSAPLVKDAQFYFKSLLQTSFHVQLGEATG